MDVWQLIVDASLVVQFVMLLLLAASIYGWTIIAVKSRYLRNAWHEAQRFEEAFWESADLANLYRDLRPMREQLSGLSLIFEAGFAEYSRLAKQGSAGEHIIDGVRRSMKIPLRRELDHAEQHLSGLATIGSVSPYIGLFGTVWGIMHAFLGLSNAQHVTMALVAPGIAEALIATAIGLFAAIPAVIGYNRFATDMDRLAGRYESFAEEFLALLHRQVHASRGTRA